jgi:ABC-type multidrug transport system ATPase subunit
LITARGLGRDFGMKRVLRDVDFEVPRGGFLLVTGPNGSGKSTLLSLCAGLLAPTAGELAVEAERGEIGYLAHERRERIGMLLERFGLWEARRERVGSLSRGTAQRLALCRAVLHEPRLLLLDEPYSGLDHAGARLLDDELGSLVGDRTFVVATHAPRRVESLATAALSLA